ncbi:hypothetical protein BS78_08G162000 [Paspalum vaginatum]|nr:hypothetical protein BS78_08G162000 [Paspalum vaginatum]
MALPPYSLRLLVLAAVLLGPTIPPSSSSSAAAAVEPLPQCNLAYTSMALLQCRETTPQAPTPPCCDTLLYSIDEWPEGPDQGVCCLCMYVVVESNMTALDLATTYVSCRGKDSRAVLQWMATMTAASPPDRPENCYDPCGIEAPPSPPPPPRPSEKKQQQHHVGVGVIVVIALGALFGVAVTGWCIYYHFFSPAAKARRSPNPSGTGTAGAEDDGDGGRHGGGVQMSRLSSSRRSSSGIL